MVLKALIIILFIAVILSLSSGLMFLLKDMEMADSKRTLYALGIRITLAASLLGLIGFAVATGRLGSSAPWDKLPTPPEQR